MEIRETMYLVSSYVLDLIGLKIWKFVKQFGEQIIIPKTLKKNCEPKPTLYFSGRIYLIMNPLTF